MAEEKKPLTLEDIKKNKELLRTQSPNTQEIGTVKRLYHL
jgi:hypothetical protein